MKVEIKGELIAPEGMTHEDLLEIIYEGLKSKDVHFTGSTKEIGQGK